MRRYLWLALWMALVGGAMAQSLPQLSYTRLLRKVTLVLQERPPSLAQYQEVLDAPSDLIREQIIAAAISNGLDSDAFYESMVGFGRDVLGAPEYKADYMDGQWHGSQALSLEACPPGSYHEGRLGLFSDNLLAGQPWSLCDDVLAVVSEVEPWWAPNTVVEAIGWAGQQNTEVTTAAADGYVIDCGQLVRLTGTAIGYAPPHLLYDDVTDACGCGPNLVYCARRGALSENLVGFDGLYSAPGSQRRAISEEPARLFAHIVVSGKPLSDLVLGAYTVTTQGLHHAYVRAARQSGKYQWLDQSGWWQSYSSVDGWVEIETSTMFPAYTSDRVVLYDPRVSVDEPPALPAAGVLTMRGAVSNEGRERARAARWLERLACREFVPVVTDSGLSIDSPDPADTEFCGTCHQVLDPAAMHFKRLSNDGARIGGIGAWSLMELPVDDPDRLRWLAQFLPGTLMTPVTEVDMAFNPDARFLDFAPPGTDVLGVSTDGTIGPLGFGKALVASGAFDRCMVRRFYGRILGVQLDFAVDKALMDSLVNEFVASGRDVRQLFMKLMTSERFRTGR